MTSATHANLSQLSVDDKVNVRRTGRGSEPEFAASIRAKGVIEPLVVRQPKGNGAYTITNGSKRFDALLYLKDKGETAKGIPVTDAYQVPIIVRQENDADARDTSLITNIVRTGMHPVDEAEAFAHLVKDGRTPAAIATAYGIDEKRVHQRLALGEKLSPKIKRLWRDNKIDDDAAQGFTLAPDHKSMDAIYDKLDRRAYGDIDARNIAEELKIKGDIGRMLVFVGVKEYEARKGKVTLDLFGSNHRVSDEKLLRAMAGEKLDAIADKLVKQDGWGWSLVVKDLHSHWQYGRLGTQPKPTAAEAARLEELEGLIDDEETSDADADKYMVEFHQLESTVIDRTFPRDKRAKAGCFVCFEHRGLKIEYGRLKPEEKKAAEAQERAATRKKKAKTAENKGESAGIISNALHQRLSEQLTIAAGATLAKDKPLALAAVLAGFASGGDVVCVSDGGFGTKRLGRSGGSVFASALQGFIDKPAGMNQALAEVAGRAVNMQVFNINSKPLANKNNVALLEAMDGDELNKQLRQGFDAADYFGNVSKGLCLKAITEAINADEARKVAGKPKGEIAKFAVDNVPRTGWLPVELRTAHYDGPGSKKPAAKKKR
jgi:ParB family chromosome partitioning protein